MLMSSKMSPSDSSFSRIFLSRGIWPFPRIWSTLGHTYTNTTPRTSICTSCNVRKEGGWRGFVFFPVKSRKTHITPTHVPARNPDTSRSLPPHWGGPMGNTDICVCVDIYVYACIRYLQIGFRKGFTHLMVPVFLIFNGLTQWGSRSKKVKLIKMLKTKLKEMWSFPQTTKSSSQFSCLTAFIEML